LEPVEPARGAQFVYTFAPEPIPIDVSQFGKAIELTDAGGLSDIVGIARFAATAPALGFSSDAEGMPSVWDPSVWGAAPGAVIPETGSPININQFLLSSAVAQGWSATFQSDVPEPSTWVMLLLGFAGLASRVIEARGSALLSPSRRVTLSIVHSGTRVRAAFFALAGLRLRVRSGRATTSGRLGPPRPFPFRRSALNKPHLLPKTETYA
jgi:hypothetical protein